jgi:hypothetical protein
VSLRHRLLEAIRGMTPRADAKWSLKLWDAGNTEFGELNTDSEATIRAAIVPADEQAESQVVTGYLTNINFTNRIVTIIYPPTKREMECVYDDAVEDLLIENRRDLIQVTGLIVLDDAGAPKKITNVNDIRELDLSPLIGRHGQGRQIGTQGQTEHHPGARHRRDKATHLRHTRRFRH